MARRAYDTRAWRRLRVAVLIRDGYRCRWCGGHARVADHVVPLAEGGAPLDAANLVAACVRCNGERAARTGAARWKVMRAAGGATGELQDGAILYGTARTADVVTGSTGTHRTRARSNRTQPDRVVLGAIRADAAES